MTTNASQVSDLNPNDPSSNLTDRVRARVAETGRLLDNRPRGKTAKRASSLTGGFEAQREAQSLQTVYREMRTLYRNYRREARTAAVPELRSAVAAFKRGQSLTSLVHIASFLDDRKLLAW
ncbi:MAG TPA: hypothetical protein VLK88_11260 [Gemmatimonadales bacterium]|nr:hypothetical protein [Gemmatimonadales bacterium]